MDEGTLSYDEFMQLSEEDKGERYIDLSDSDKFKVRQGMNPGFRGIVCNHCRHNHWDYTCDAFPKGIPKGILDREEHDTPYPGDKGIRFEAESDAERAERLKRYNENIKGLSFEELIEMDSQKQRNAIEFNK